MKADSRDLRLHLDTRPSHGGSELLKYALLRGLRGFEAPNVNLIVNDTHQGLIKKGQVNVLWLHHNVNEAAAARLAQKEYTDQIDFFVYVSHWQFEKFRYKFRIPEDRSIVIRNAVTAQDLEVPKPKEIKLVYTTTPWRGLDLLLDCFEALNRDDVSLDVYSSTIIYGEAFHAQFDGHFQPLFDRARQMRNVDYRGFVPNEDVRKALLSAHILAYPSIWEETSCLSAIEAAMAGLSIVTTNLGALPETLGAWARFVTYDDNLDNLKRSYTRELNRAIDDFWHPATQEVLLDQHRYFHRFWSWETRIDEWKRFLECANSAKSPRSGAMADARARMTSGRLP